MVKKSKPAPDIFIKTFELLEEKHNQCYILEDSNNGIVAAHLSGGITILVPDKDKIRDENLKKAKYIFNDLLEVKKFLENQKMEEFSKKHLQDLHQQAVIELRN